MTRRRAVLPLLALLALACARAVPPAEIPARMAALANPHLVLIVVDTLRADATTPYGAPPGVTPELSAWSERGAVFERVRAQSSWTKISMASLFTSLWPHSLGIREARDGLASEALTLAETLRTAGYRTAAVQTNGWLDQSFGFQQGFDRYVFPKGGGGAALGAPTLWPHADRVVEEASRVISAHDPTRPLFLYLHFMDVHEYAAPPEFKRFGTDTRGAYRAAAHWVDDAVSRVRAALERAELLDRTLLVFAADHGETFGEHGVHGHARNVLTPVVSVPLVLRFPFAAQPIRVATQVRNLDIAPTLLALLGVGVPQGFEGASLVPLLVGETEDDRVSFAALGTPLFRDASVQTAVTDGTWTYARNAEPAEELLFDRRVDPAENANLALHEPEALAHMRGVLGRHLAEPTPGLAAKNVRIDPSIAERLRAMGYLK